MSASAVGQTVVVGPQGRVVVAPTPPPLVLTPAPAPPQTAAIPAPTPAYEGNWITLTGVVTSLDGDDFFLDVGGTRIEIDTNRMDMSPVEDPRGPRVGPGDRVSVYGQVDDIRDGRIDEVDARTVTLIDRSHARRTAR
jgi:hypothetical protein